LGARFSFRSPYPTAGVLSAIRAEQRAPPSSIEIAIISGGNERQRALRYADREYGEFDEIELEPY